MRPCSVYANLAWAAGCPCDILRSLYGPHRVGVRLVMILLSAHGQTAGAIAEVLGCDASTVRRWIHRDNQHGIAELGDQPRPGRPRLGSPRRTQRILRLVAEPKAWTIPRLYQRLGRPAMSLATFRRRVREVAGWRRPRLMAKGDPGREAVLASLHQRLTELPEEPVVLAEDEPTCTCCPGCAPPGSPRVRANR
jgi:transposase